MRIKHVLQLFLHWVLASIIGKTEAAVKIAVKCKCNVQCGARRKATEIRCTSVMYPIVTS